MQRPPSLWIYTVPAPSPARPLFSLLCSTSAPDDDPDLSSRPETPTNERAWLQLCRDSRRALGLFRANQARRPSQSRDKCPCTHGCVCSVVALGQDRVPCEQCPQARYLAEQATSWGLGLQKSALPAFVRPQKGVLRFHQRSVRILTEAALKPQSDFGGTGVFATPSLSICEHVLCSVDSDFV